MARRTPDYYQRLGVSPEASPEEIHSAYRRLARRYHPDMSSHRDAGDRFNEVSDAYEVLHDPSRRERYDRSTAPAAAPDVPIFSARSSRRDVPRFIDEPVSLGVRFGRRSGVRVQFFVRLWR